LALPFFNLLILVIPDTSDEHPEKYFYLQMKLWNIPLQHDFSNLKR